MSDNEDFGEKNITRVIERCYMMIKWSVYECVCQGSPRNTSHLCTHRYCTYTQRMRINEREVDFKELAHAVWED